MPINYFVMLCVTSKYHTICLSDDGIVHSFGRNHYGQLGLEDFNLISSVPNAVPNLPKIKLISCGWNFTVCVDNEGCLWSFGKNDCGQLGIGECEEKEFSVPQKIHDIPPVQAISCGLGHTLIITIDSNLWSFGNNYFGQLCFGDTKDRAKPKQTLFSNIIKISCNSIHSFFQNNKEEIYCCGNNSHGQLGLGHIECQHEVIVIPNHPLNIINFCCGYYHSLFLDFSGNVYSVGYNKKGSLGLGHTKNMNLLTQIPNIPPVQSISCIKHSSYLIDFKGNLWSFGKNKNGELGLGDFENRIIPTKTSLKNIQQHSSGGASDHFLVKDSKNNIFAMGKNDFGQTGTRSIVDSNFLPNEVNSLTTIWGESLIHRPYSTEKSARK